MKILGASKPSLADLAHFGVKGMHWGVRRSSPSGGGSAPPTRKQRRAMDKAALARQKTERKTAISVNDAEIRGARARVGEAHANIQAAKAKFKDNKRMLGKVTAREILDKTTQKDYETLSRAADQTHHEAIGGLLGAAAAITLATVVKSSLR